jgi:hypothetical protein
MNIRQFYLETYPSDELGMEINPSATFDGLVSILNNHEDVYEYIGFGDSIIRERLFHKLSELTGTEYNVIYELWMDSADVYESEF